MQINGQERPGESRRAPGYTNPEPTRTASPENVGPTAHTAGLRLRRYATEGHAVPSRASYVPMRALLP